MYETLKKDVNYYWVILSLGFATAGFVIRAIRWKLLIEPLGHSPSNKNLILAVIIGYFANIAIPRIGEVTRCASVNKTDKIPVNSLLGTVIIERIIDMLSLLILIAVVLVAKISLFKTFFKDNLFIPLYNKYSTSFNYWYIFIFIIVAILVFLLIRKKLMKTALYHKAVEFLKGLYDGFMTFLKMKKRGKFILYTLLIWFAYFLQTYIVFFALKSTSNLTLFDGLFILVAGSLGMVVPVQSGFGAYHWIVTLGLMMYGISQTDGLLYATLCHESQMILFIIIGSISMFIVFAGKNKNKAEVN